jgi:hypothetical protein
MTLDENSVLSLLSRTQLLKTSYLRDTLVIVGKENPCQLTSTATILLPSHLTSRHHDKGKGGQLQVIEHCEGAKTVIKWRHNVSQSPVAHNTLVSYK